MTNLLGFFAFCLFLGLVTGPEAGLFRLPEFVKEALNKKIHQR